MSVTPNQANFGTLVKLAARIVDIEGRPVFSHDEIEAMFLRASFRVDLGTFFRKDAHRIVDEDGTVRWEWTEKGERWSAYASTPYPRIMGTIKVNTE